MIGAARTPIGGYLGSLSKHSAPELGSIAIQGALKQSSKTAVFIISANIFVELESVDEVVFGNVVSAGVGQAPARQAALKAGLPVGTVCTTVNKVCSSGLKAVALAAQSIQLGQSSSAVAGGMESMSNAPFYVDGKARRGLGLGDGKLVDAVIKDGLWDPGHQLHMGSCAEETAKKYNIGREQQDAYAKRSYERAQAAIKNGTFKREIVAVGDVVQDEEPAKANFAKFSTLKPAFLREGGTITAANASSLSDGAAAVVLTSEQLAKDQGLPILAKIISYADAETEPKNFPIAPALAIPKALKRAQLTAKDISLWEINEAFSVVVLANQQVRNPFQNTCISL